MATHIPGPEPTAGTEHEQEHEQEHEPEQEQTEAERFSNQPGMPC
jgi:hypothetical protein